MGFRKRKIAPRRKTLRKVEPRKPYRAPLQLEPKQKLGPGVWKKKPTKLPAAKPKPKTLVTGQARKPTPTGLVTLRGKLGAKRVPKPSRSGRESPRKLPRGKPIPGVAKRPGPPPTQYEDWVRRERALKRPTGSAKPLKRVTLGRGIPITKPPKRGKSIKRKARPIRRRRMRI